MAAKRNLLRGSGRVPNRTCGFSKVETKRVNRSGIIIIIAFNFNWLDDKSFTI